MDLKATNLEDIQRMFYSEGLGPGALKLVESLRYLYGNGDARLADLLRHHDRPVSLIAEIYLRDCFDELLSFYSLLEVASQIEYVPTPLPAALAASAQEVLRNPSVMEFYQTHYPLVLPRVFARRIDGDLPLVEKSDAAAATRVFLEFLGLELRFRRNREVALVLRLLDSFVIGGITIQDVIAALGTPDERFNEALAARTSRNILGSAVRGLFAVISHFRRVDRLLQKCEGSPLFQSSLWYYHEYWLTSLAGSLRQAVDQTLENLLRWNQEEDDREASEEDAKDLKASIARLTSDRYRRPLLEAAKL
jgi:hypothetical protein